MAELRSNKEEAWPAHQQSICDSIYVERDLDGAAACTNPTGTRAMARKQGPQAIGQSVKPNRGVMNIFKPTPKLAFLDGDRWISKGLS